MTICSSAYRARAPGEWSITRAGSLVSRCSVGADSAPPLLRCSKRRQTAASRTPHGIRIVGCTVFLCHEASYSRTCIRIAFGGHPTVLRPAWLPCCNPRRIRHTLSNTARPHPPDAASCNHRTPVSHPPRAMPRARVKPQDRVRVAKACEYCKLSRKRCDGGRPCSLCLKKDLADSCSYSLPTPREQPPAVHASHVPPPLPPSPPQGQQYVQPLSPQRRLVRPPLPRNASVESGDSDNGALDSFNSSSFAQQPVMLTSSSGEQGMTCPNLPLVLVS